MVRIDAHGVALEVERELAVLDVLQLVFVEVRPTPDARIDDVREALASCDLQSSIQRSLDGDALARMGSVGCDGCDQ